MAKYNVGDPVTIQNTETGEVVETVIKYVSIYDNGFDTGSGYTVADHTRWVVKTPGTDTTLENKYLTAALVALGMDDILTAYAVRHIIETARKIEEATK